MCNYIYCRGFVFILINLNLPENARPSRANIDKYKEFLTDPYDGWMNDDCINDYLKLLQETAFNKDRVLILSTHFASLLMTIDLKNGKIGEYSYAKVRKWTKAYKNVLKILLANFF